MTFYCFKALVAYTSHGIETRMPISLVSQPRVTQSQGEPHDLSLKTMVLRATQYQIAGSWIHRFTCHTTDKSHCIMHRFH